MKRKISLVLVLAILVSCFTFVGTSAANKTDKNIKLLNLLGIDKIYEEDAENFITRQELAYLAVSLGSGGNADAGFSTYDMTYTDVDPKSDYAPYIAQAAHMGYMGGIGGGKFDPSGFVSRENMTRVMMRVLAFAAPDVSEEEYAKLATSFKLYKDIYLSSAQKLTVGEAAAVAVNTLNAKMYYMKDYSYDIQDGTLLNQVFRLRYEDGLFLSKKAAGLDKNEVVVDSVKYKNKTGETLDEYSGYNVRAYIDVDTDELKYVDTELFENGIYTVDSTDIIGVDGSVFKFYGQDGNERKVTIKNMTEIYNGVVATLTPNDFAVSNGTVEFVSCGGTYEAARINSYDALVVGGFSKDTVFDYYTNTYNHEFKAEEKTEFILNGKEIKINDLKKGDVLSIAYSKDKKYCTVYVSRDTVSGAIIELTSKYFKVNRKQIYRSRYFAKNVEDPALGKYVTVALDYFGRAAAILDESIAGTEYKYLIDAAQDNGLDANVYLKMYDLTNGIQIYPVASKVEVNGEYVKNPSLNFNNDSYLTSGDELSRALRTRATISADEVVFTVMRDCVSQLVKVSINSDGYVTILDTAWRGQNEDDASLTLAGKVNNDKTNYPYKPGAKGFARSYRLANGITFALYAPNEKLNQFNSDGYLTENNRGSVEDTNFIEAMAILSNDTGYNALAYDVTDGGLAKALIVENPNLGKSKGEVDGEAELFVISEIRKATNRKGQESYKVIGYKDGNLGEYTVANPDTFLKNLDDPASVYEAGDVCQIQYDQFNEISNITLRYDHTYNYVKDIKWNAACLLNDEDGYVFSSDEYGYIVVKKNAYDKLLATGSTELPSEYRIYSAEKIYDGRIYVYDSKDKKVTMGTVNDILSYKTAGANASFVAFRLSYNVPTAVIIYK